MYVCTYVDVILSFTCLVTCSEIIRVYFSYHTTLFCLLLRASCVHFVEYLFSICFVLVCFSAYVKLWIAQYKYYAVMCAHRSIIKMDTSIVRTPNQYKS